MGMLMGRYKAISIAFVATAGPLLSVLSGDIASAGTDQALAAYQRGDLATGLKELEAGAAVGEPEAFYNLGITYTLGAGVTADRKKAAAYFLQGADRGNVFAAFEIGESYETGKGIEQNFKEAGRWYRVAAMRGHYKAGMRLGTLYYAGTGVPADLIEAFSWIYPAAHASIMDDDAINACVRLAGEMTKAQLAKGEARGKRYYESYMAPNMKVVKVVLASNRPQ